MFTKDGHNEIWRDGVYLCTAESSFQADLFESKLRSEGIPCVKRYRGSSNYLEIFMGNNTLHPIDIYVPEQTLEDAQNTILAIPLEECEDRDIPQ